MKNFEKIVYKPHEIIVIVIFIVFLIWGGYKYTQNREDDHTPTVPPTILNDGPSRSKIEDYINNKTLPEGFNPPDGNIPR